MDGRLQAFAPRNFIEGITNRNHQVAVGSFIKIPSPFASPFTQKDDTSDVNLGNDIILKCVDKATY